MSVGGVTSRLIDPETRSKITAFGLFSGILFACAGNLKESRVDELQGCRLLILRREDLQ